MADAESDPEIEQRRERFSRQRERLAAKYLKPAAERPPSIARGVHHVALICGDVEETIRFYQEVVGFPLLDLFENRDYAGSTHFFHDLGHGNTLAFFDFPGHSHPEFAETLGGLQHCAISVTPEHFAAARGRLEAAGVHLHGPDEGIEGSIYFRDPNGAQIELTTDPLMEMMDRPLASSGP